MKLLFLLVAFGCVASQQAHSLPAHSDLTGEEKECLEYLIATMPNQDKDKLTIDFLLENVRLALQAREATTWASTVPWDTFLDYVLPYASLSEKRDVWRPEFFKRFLPLVQNSTSIASAALQLNGGGDPATETAWDIVDPPIIFVAAPPDEVNQYSPFEVMRSHNASCTGLSVFLVAALRSVGIPARVAGVPHWNLPSCNGSLSDPSCGNHDWVEVWVGSVGGWQFLDQRTGSGFGVSWFYPGHSQYAIAGSVDHGIFAVNWNATNVWFPMVWDPTNQNVGGVDVTPRYLTRPETTTAAAETTTTTTTTAETTATTAETAATTTTTAETTATRPTKHKIPTVTKLWAENDLEPVFDTNN